MNTYILLYYIVQIFCTFNLVVYVTACLCSTGYLITSLVWLPVDNISTYSVFLYFYCHIITVSNASNASYMINYVSSQSYIVFIHLKYYLI